MFSFWSFKKFFVFIFIYSFFNQVIDYTFFNYHNPSFRFFLERRLRFYYEIVNRRVEELNEGHIIFSRVEKKKKN